jgi:hypothetical protein
LLLQYMSQLMCHQPLSFPCLRRILPCPKHHILIHCKHLRRLRGLWIRMYLHLAKIITKPRFEISPFGLYQRRPAAANRIDLRFKTTNNFRRCILPNLCLKHLFFLLLFIDLHLSSYSICHPISILFIHIAGLACLQVRLQRL